jgi:hypothetical protein
MVPDALRTVENVFGSANHKNGTRCPPPKTSTGTQNMKMGPDALGTAENEYDDAQHQTGPYALGTVEN